MQCFFGKSISGRNLYVYSAIQLVSKRKKSHLCLTCEIVMQGRLLKFCHTIYCLQRRNLGRDRKIRFPLQNRDRIWFDVNIPRQDLSPSPVKWPSESDDQTKDLQGLPLHIIIKFPTCYCRVLQLPPKGEGGVKRYTLQKLQNCPISRWARYAK